MSFSTDKQTLDDLNIVGKYKQNSTFSLFNTVVTRGGEKLLEEFFHAPLESPEKINERSRLFHFFQKGNYQFPIKKQEFAVAEQYLNHIEYPNKFAVWFNSLRMRMLCHIGLDREFKIMQAGMIATMKVLQSLRQFIEEIGGCKEENLYAEKQRAILRILQDSRLSFLNTPSLEEKVPLLKFVQCDYSLRCLLRKEMRILLDSIYEIDVNIAVAAVAAEKNLCYAIAEAKENNRLCFEGLFHFGIKNAVTNNIQFCKEKNVLFLTGANMAGKSTLMKAIGIASYLAHMGFPVPAKQMTFSVKEGLFTSINVPDNLNMGYSHFYAEVLRVKTIAQQLASNRRLLIIFDELFKGTNVKDAYEATVSITNAFSKKQNSCFIISTHIMEAGEALYKKGSNIQFLFLPTQMKGVVPIYTYKLQEGITNDRHGMLIINNEKIIEIINGKS